MVCPAPQALERRRRRAVLAVALALAGGGPLLAGCRSAAPTDAAPPTPLAAGATSPANRAAADAPATARPSPPATRLPGQQLTYEGVHIRVPDALAERVVPSFIPAAPEGRYPVAGRVRFVLEGYPLAGRSEPAIVEVFHGPAADDAPEGLLERYRPFYALIDGQTIPPGFVPMMPEDRRQQFQARPTYRSLAFQPGRGLRFLTQFGAASRPVNNAELMYVFQGLSPVQAAWISITAPVAVDDPLVVAAPDAPTPAALASGYTPYIQRTIHQLGVLPADAFTPSLDWLDEMAASIVIDWPPPEWARPPTAPAGTASP